MILNPSYLTYFKIERNTIILVYSPNNNYSKLKSLNYPKNYTFQKVFYIYE